ncbi:MAG: hypothetical protein IT378_18975 [Sandaracinaceae bacterium]|nr:hypothetical protein [Sandaracinaceae bacterium]
MDTPEQSPEPRRRRKTTAPVETSEAVETPAEHASKIATSLQSEGSAVEDGASEARAQHASDPSDARRRITEQLAELKRKEAELRRALAIAEHPELGDALRLLEGRAYAVVRAEGKLSQGLSKSEERRRETLEKKLEALRLKRADLDAQIGALESELAPFGEGRLEAFRQERHAALEALAVAIGAHGAELGAAGLDVEQLVPDVARWVSELRAIGEAMVARATAE